MERCIIEKNLVFSICLTITLIVSCVGILYIMVAAHELIHYEDLKKYAINGTSSICLFYYDVEKNVDINSPFASYNFKVNLSSNENFESIRKKSENKAYIIDGIILTIFTAIFYVLIFEVFKDNLDRLIIKKLQNENKSSQE